MVGEGEKQCGLVVYTCLLNSNSVSVIDSVYEQLMQKWRVVLFGDFNARVGKSVAVDDTCLLNSNSVSVIDSVYEQLMQKWRVVLFGDFNARVGKSVAVDYVIGIFWEDTCNRNGNILISFLNKVELVICNGRELVSELE